MKYRKLVKEVAKEIAQYPNKNIGERIKLTAKKLSITEGEVIIALARPHLEFIDFVYSQK